MKGVKVFCLRFSCICEVWVAVSGRTEERESVERKTVFKWSLESSWNHESSLIKPDRYASLHYRRDLK